jgi:hypothetical protein
MRTGRIGGLCFAGGLVLLWMGCGGHRTSSPIYIKNVPRAPPRSVGRCVHDADCYSGFCDRGQCRGLHGNDYGGVCDQRAPTRDAIERLPESLCDDGFLCLDGRCRSCRSDAECQSHLGTGKCIVNDEPDGRQRAACFPETTRRGADAPCSDNADCRSLFCDRGTCAGILDVGSWSYGLQCTPGPPRALPEDLLDPGEGNCDGYLCIDQRCRSCQSDAECQEGSSPVKCVPFSNLPGKVCVPLTMLRAAQSEPPPRAPYFSPTDP